MSVHDSVFSLQLTNDVGTMAAEDAGCRPVPWTNTLLTKKLRDPSRNPEMKDVPNTNDREDRAIRRVATSAPTTSLASIQRHLPPFQTSSAIKRNHKETGLTEDGLRSRRPLIRLPLTLHHRQCRLDFADLGQSLECDRLRRVIFSDESRFSLKVLMTTAHVS
ncbi:hypothetical protein TNCV_4540721 [Trichonephila clavipes]|nr:hypothetical protein TNCV_4540721 [Trichonephila clavipes]